MKTTLAGRIASLVAAIGNCQRAGNWEWEGTHKQTLDALRHALPSGSGIDAGTGIDIDASTPEKLVLIVGFHHMDENGGYDGWTYHRVTVKASLLHGLQLTISGPDRNGIKDYLHDVYVQALGEVQS